MKFFNIIKYPLFKFLISSVICEQFELGSN